MYENVDLTAGEVETPLGPGKFVEYCREKNEVSVMMDYEWIVTFSGDNVFIIREKGG